MFTWYAISLVTDLPKWLTVMISVISLITFIPCAAFCFGKIVKEVARTGRLQFLVVAAWLIAFGMSLAYGAFGLAACGVTAICSVVLESLLHALWVMLVKQPFGIGNK